jgi:hypothetical protein
MSGEFKGVPVSELWSFESEFLKDISILVKAVPILLKQDGVLLGVMKKEQTERFACISLPKCSNCGGTQLQICRGVIEQL